MGEVVKFERRSQKLTGFIPPIVVNPPRAMHRDPFVVIATAILTIGFLPLIAAEVWFGDGWQYR